ncbi:hypothetical protein [Pseudomonas donghuensis]|uniref:hypothetical protein n=1 Tax=Pseudomonas donghuensis TaxID=1163398 RepID=UPI0039E0409C
MPAIQALWASGASVVAFCFHTKRPSEAEHMSLNRDLQRRILERISAAYPYSLPDSEYDELAEASGEEVLDANLYYLIQHGLIENCLRVADREILVNTSLMKCTAKGMDFLADDGGLSAILDTVTVKLHEDTLRQLIEAKIQAADLPEEKKSGILKALREAPGETTKQLITKLVDLGMENAPKALPLIQTLLQGGHP